VQHNNHQQQQQQQQQQLGYRSIVHVHGSILGQKFVGLAEIFGRLNYSSGDMGLASFRIQIDSVKNHTLRIEFYSQKYEFEIA